MRHPLVALLAGALAIMAACTTAADKPAAIDSSHAAAPADTDDFGAPLPTDARFAARVVSLNPAATEIIFAIGADSALVGRSRWDEFPKEVERIMPVGDGIRPSIETVLSVQPTLVILYATADNRSAAEALTRAGVKTVALRADRIAGFYALTQRLGVMLGATTRADVVVDSVRRTIERVRALTATIPERPTVVWPVWESPPMVIGGGSYLDELLTIAGARNVFHDDSTASPSVSIEEIARRAPALVITGSTRVAALKEATSWRAVPAVREGHFVVVDQDVTGRPSVVLGMAATHLARLFHPTLADSLR
ncbi:ABC transporter substrate binding protein [Gemmatimonas aurantiaca T-27]|uniref:ABC transporter substrate binding protein n=2 Tax=Gemmatimonas aurantiaca TaxID=173480 RepID=C1A8G9_GEMAT|nr:helical backbone metal receptor [Gemmatimonas aurantiaca]BAH38529.1 ABC transporter substrate binding protein [Gemmatimonas aurantiaca T-27]